MDNRGAIIKLVLTIPTPLEKVLVFVLLLYRRLRYGYPFRRIPLTKGKFAIVDPEDYERLSRYKWNTYKGYSTYYAKRKIVIGKGRGSKEVTIYMHRCIIDVPKGLMVDHINHNGLDNRKVNLRVATRAQNSRNIRKSQNKFSSNYKGVHFRRRERLWMARITVDGRTLYLGDFKEEVDAARAHDRAAKKYHGEFAALNFPD